MKKINYLFLAGAAALASCSSDEFIGEQGYLSQDANEAILFGAKGKAITRATATGATAATKLNNHFVVYGTKHTAAEDNTATNDALVFNQYQVEWTDNSAGTSADNTHNWGYVGKTAYVKNGDNNVTQTIKYWDLDAAQGYTFYAFSSSNISYPANVSDLVSVAKTTTGTTKYDKGYAVTIKNGANLDNLYYSDRLEVAKAKYGDPVVLNFRNIASKIRVGFYETIPGYSVKIDKFYYDDDATAAVTTYKAMDKTSTSFKAALQNVNATAASSTMTVVYYDNNSTFENRPKVTNTTVTYKYDLTLGDVNYSTTTLGTSASAPTWDKSAGAYTTVFPNEGNTNPMLIRLDYTLTSLDGSGEIIKVKNARAIVPTQYVQWKSNTAYTYLFKISDNTNGTTGTTPTDPDAPTGDKEGLFPITFDAVVIATEDGNSQETITTLATNSVTTYSEGKITNEYAKDKDIYVVTNTQATGHAILPPSAIGEDAGNAQVYSISGTSAGTATEADVLGKLTGLTNSTAINLTAVAPAATLVKEVPAYDGTKYDFGEKGAVKFTPSAAGKYAYVYCTTKYVAPTYASVSSESYSSAIQYYFKTGDVYSAASGLSEANWETYKSSLYKQTTAGTAGDYTVKVITVQ